MNQRFPRRAHGLVILTSVVGAIAVALIQPSSATAHFTDLQHQHGYDRSLMYGPELLCVGGLFGQPGVVRLSPPNLMSSPGTLRRVYFSFGLEYYDFGQQRWLAGVWNGTRYDPLFISGWYFTAASWNTTFVGGWSELSTGRIQQNAIGVNVTPGYYYRARIFYHWGADAVQQKHEDVTNHCYVQ